MGQERIAPSLCPGVIKVEERPLFDRLKQMYSKRTKEGERVRYEYDTDRFSDLDRIEALCALDSRVAEYRTYVRTRIGSYDTISMLDTGNSFADVINADMKRALGIKKSDLRPYKGRSSIGTAKVAARMRIEGETKEEYEIFLSPSLPPIRTRLVVLPELGMPCNISGRTMERNGISIHVGRHANYRGEEIPLITRKDSGPVISRYSAHMLPIYTARDVTVQPFERVHVSAIVVDKWENNNVRCAVLTPSSRFEDRFEISPWRSAMIPLWKEEGGSKTCSQYKSKVGMINSTAKPVKIPAGTYYGEAELVTSISDPRRDDFRVCFINNNGRKRRRNSKVVAASAEGEQESGVNFIHSEPESNSGLQRISSKSTRAKLSSVQNKLLNGNKTPQQDTSGIPPNGNKTGQESKLSAAVQSHKADGTSIRGNKVRLDENRCYRNEEKKGKYIIPPSPDKQGDPLAGDPVELPDWMKGETSHSNYKQRYEYLTDLFKVKANKNLEDLDRRVSFIDLLLLHWNLFAWDGTYGKTSLIKHYIKTPPDCKPINDRYRPPNPALRESLRKQLQKWLQHKCIEPSDSEWNSNLLAVVKSSDIDSVRWVVDYRRLNSASTIDRFPIGDIQDNLSRLGRSKYFSCLDNSGAFHCIEIAPEDRHKTSFATPFNCWQFCRLPFGLSGGPSSYARLVIQVLKNIPPEQAVAYVDDILIHSGTFEQHMSNLDAVFKAYTKAGLKLNPKKCHFMASKIDYLGHTVSEAGIEPQEAYLKIVKDWPIPLSRQDVLVFLGKIGYYRKFVKDFAKKAKPLTDLLKIAKDKSKDKSIPTAPMSKSQRRKIMEEPVKLSQECIKAFKLLKKALLNPPIHAHPRFDNLKKQFYILDTDWCQETNTVSGVLSQNQLMKDGKYQEKVIGYASKKLNKSQANYSSPKGEICAILLMIDHYKYHLMIGKFLLRTDNIAARALKDNTGPTGYLSRWQARLANYDFTIVHRAGTKHGNADSLSRIKHTTNHPEDNADVFDEKTDRQYLFAIDEDEAKVSTRDEVWTPSYLQELQEEDPDLSDLRKWVKEGQKPSTQLRAEASSDLKTFINLFESLYIDERNVLMYKYCYTLPDGLGPRERHLVVLPEAPLRDAIRIIHEKRAHVGVRNTIDASLKHVYGIRLRDAAEYVCRTCLVCQAKGGKPKAQDYSLVVPRQGIPFQSINIDFVGPLTPSRKHQNIYLLTVEDMLSKWVEAFPLKRATAAEVIRILTTEIFPRFGYPEFLKCDRGAHFKNQMMQELAEMTGIRLMFSPSYRPQSNPVERAHGTIKKRLLALILDVSKGDPASWESHLPTALFVYRTTRHSTTGASPFETLFGNPPSTEASLIFGPPPDRADYEDQRSYAIAHRTRMKQAFRWANENISATIARRRRYYYDNPKRLMEPGTRVWLMTPVIRTSPGQRKSLRSPWTGPWTIVKRVNEVVYEIQPHHNWSRKGNEVVTVDRLKIYESPDDEGEGENETHPPGIHQQLSFPGDDFLETFKTNPQSPDDDDGEVEYGADDNNGQPNLDPAPDPEPAPDPAPTPPPSPGLGAGDNFPFDPLQENPMIQPQNDPPPVDVQPPHLAAPPPVVVHQPIEPPLPLQPVAGPAAPPAARTGARVKVPRPPSEWRSRQKGKWADSTPTRVLPRRDAAHASFRGGQVYKPERRQQNRHHDSDDDDVAEIDQTLPQVADSPAQLEWDYSDLRTAPDDAGPPTDEKMGPSGPSAPSGMHCAPVKSAVKPITRPQFDLSDQSTVLRQRQKTAENNDCRSTGPANVRKSELRKRKQTHCSRDINRPHVRTHARTSRELAAVTEEGKLELLPSRCSPSAATQSVTARSRSSQPPPKTKAQRPRRSASAKPAASRPAKPEIIDENTLAKLAFKSDFDFEKTTQRLRRTIAKNESR